MTKPMLQDLGLFGNNVGGHGFFNTGIEDLGVFVKDNCVGSAVQILKTQCRCILLVYLVNGILNNSPFVLRATRIKDRFLGYMELIPIVFGSCLKNIFAINIMLCRRPGLMPRDSWHLEYHTVSLSNA